MDKILQMLDEMGIPFAYDHFAEGESPDPPFICYLIPGTDHFSADGKVYQKINEIHTQREKLYSAGFSADIFRLRGIRRVSTEKKQQRASLMH